MKLYSALIKKNEEGKISDAKLLKEGFSFFAFLAGPLWFFYHKMWREFFALLLTDVALGLFVGFDQVFLEISLAFIVALNANYWLAENLKKKNYQFTGLVFGENLTAANLRFAQNFDTDISSFGEEILNPQCLQKSKS